MCVLLMLLYVQYKTMALWRNENELLFRGFTVDKIDMLHKVRRHMKLSLPRKHLCRGNSEIVEEVFAKGSIRARESVAESAHITGSLRKRN